MKAPRVSGPWLEYWGGNANALPHSTFYTRRFLSFPPCGTMFPGDLNLQDTWPLMGSEVDKFPKF